MLSNTGKAVVAVAAIFTMIAAGPVVSQAFGLAEGPVVTHSMAWESEQEIHTSSAAMSNQAVLDQAEEERAAAQKRKKEEAARKAAAEKTARDEQRRALENTGGTPAQNKELGMAMCADQGWNASQCGDLAKLWQRESGWDHTAENGSSGAYGIPQALPGSKMVEKGSDWRTNPRTQIAWGLSYIEARYGNPSSAWNHAQNRGWY